MSSHISIEVLKSRGFESEMKFSVSRSSGPGGQHVNKVNTRVELRFDVQNSLVLSDNEKSRILSFSSYHLTNSGELLIDAQTERSQYKNKVIAIEKFYLFLSKALYVPKKRKPSKPTRASKEKRLKQKKHLSAIKKQRKSPEL